jgi:hypothetical protein
MPNSLRRTHARDELVVTGKSVFDIADLADTL